MFARFLLLACSVFLAVPALAETAPFDLAGPTLDVQVMHNKTTLPISQVPNLSEGDQLTIKADLPATQSANYLMVVAFLSGSTNPPPKDWFFPCKTWKTKCARNGLTVTVPQGAQQMLVFLAPETSGDFSTLVSAVRGRPGAFVRASQDLNQAALDRSRLEHYLSTVHVLDDADAARLKEVAPVLARSLAIKIDEKCLQKIPELQASCLMQGGESLILNDGHSTSLVEALTNGPTSDFLIEASTTQPLGYGYYSPYVASILDIGRIMSSFTTAQYQYIPALASADDDKLDLTLNTAPSFNDPKSVLVIAMPAIEPAQLPPLHAVDPDGVYCANRAALVLPVEGAPLVFSTDYAHDITLTLTGADGKNIELPTKANAARGGYVVDTSLMPASEIGDGVQASLKGYWGFEPYTGPAFQLRYPQASTWTLAPGDEQALIVGRQDTIHLHADSVSCVNTITLKDSVGKQFKADWKALDSSNLEVQLPLQDAQPGVMTLMVSQYGSVAPQSVVMHAFSDAAHLDGFFMHAGDTGGVLKGSRLDQVARLSIGSANFLPGALSTQQGSDELTMSAQDAQAAAALKQGHAIPASATLKDGRVLKLAATVDAPRPVVQLIGKSTLAAPAASSSEIRMGDPDELPLGARLTFALRMPAPARFTRDQLIEVATVDGAFSTTLSISNGGLRLENSQVAIATLDPATAFGPSAFGPLQFRVQADNATGDWLPLATLVRLPTLSKIKCPAAADAACTLSGSALFLIDSLSSDPQFSRAVQVPDGFPGYSIPVPHPADGKIYMKLRDDPDIVNSVALAVQTDAATAAAAPPAAATNTATPDGAVKPQ